MRFSILVICVGGLMSCVRPPNLPAENLRGVECMADILRTMTMARDVRVGSTYDPKERRYYPALSYRFANSTGLHRVEIRVVGDDRSGYSYIVTSIPEDDGSPIMRDLLDEWYERCGAEGIAIEM
jgi:hypothetical protein